MYPKRFLYLLVLIWVATQVLGACSDAGPRKDTRSDKGTAAARPVVTKAKLSPELEFEVLAADLLRVSNNKAFDSRYSSLLSNPPKKKYAGWSWEAGSRVTTTGIDPPERGARFLQLLVEFVNVGAKASRLNVSPRNEKGLDLALVLPTGKEIDAWEFLGSEWFPDYESAEAHLARHGDDIAVQVSFEGRLYSDLEPGQRVWLALLFELPASGAEDLTQLRLCFKDKVADVPPISG